MVQQIKNKINNITNEIKIFIISNKKSLISYFLVLFVVYIVALVPLIRANFNYIDDLGRALEGYRGWDDFSRFGSEFLSIFIHGGESLTDISPFPLLLSVIILCLASIILIYSLSDNNKFSFWKVFAVIPLGLSPLFLECLSYKFDCVYISLSVLICIVPFLFYKKKAYIYFIVTVLSMIFMCVTYQASSGIYPMIVLVLALKLWNEKEDNKNILKFIFISFIGYCVALLIVKFGIMNEINSYISSSIFKINDLIPGVYNNFKEYLSLIKSYFTEIWLVLIIIIASTFVITSIVKSKQKSYLAIPVSIITLLLTFVLCFGVYPLLEKPLFLPRAMYGFGAFVAIIGIYAVDLKTNYVAKIACFILAWLFINFTLTYGNALAEQKRYTDFRIQNLISDMSDCEIFNSTEEKIVILKGSIGKSPVVERISNNYPILNSLVPNTLAEDWYWSQFYFYNYFNLKNIKAANGNLDEEKMNLLKESMYQKIYNKDNLVLIVLK